MFAQVHYLENLSGRELDRYLEQGWFRMGQTIFTTNFLHFKHRYYSAIWLRVVLKDLADDKTLQKLSKRNARFEMKVQPASLDVSKEELFARYKQAVSFETSPSLYHLLYGNAINNIYSTMEVCLYDQGRLIAVGLFDTGEHAAAGITSFYDPAYKKYSLGKYLIVLKMKYCKEYGYKHFYPGYFVPGYPFFNYKLELGASALEYLDLIKGSWLPVSSFTLSPFNIMEQKLTALQQLLASGNIETRLFKYEFFDANLFPELKDAALFDFPLFLNCFTFHEDIITPMIVFDVRDNCYHLVQCRSIWASNLPVSKDEVYSWHLLKVEQEWLVTPLAEEVATRLSRELKYNW
jgi:leucyl-tRNA---protein transferase